MTSYNKISLQHCTVLIFVSVVWAFLLNPHSTIFPSNSLVYGRRLHKKAGAGAGNHPPPPPPLSNTNFGEVYPSDRDVTHITPGSVIARERPDLIGRWAIRATIAETCSYYRGFLVSGPGNTPDTDDFVQVFFYLTRELHWEHRNDSPSSHLTLRTSEIPTFSSRLNAVLTEIYQPAVCPAAEDVTGADGSVDDWLVGGAAAACPAPAGPVANSSSSFDMGEAAAQDSSSSSSDEDSAEEYRPKIAEQAAAEGGAVAANVLVSARGLSEDDNEDQLPTKVIYSAEGQWDLMLNHNVCHWPTELFTFVRDRTDWEYKYCSRWEYIQMELFAFDKLEVRESPDGSTRVVRILIDDDGYVEIRGVTGARIDVKGLKSSVKISFSPDSEDGSSNHARGAILLSRNADPTTDVSKEDKERMAEEALDLQSILLGFGVGAEAVCPAAEDVTGVDGSVDDWLVGGAAAACRAAPPAPVTAPAVPVASSSSSFATAAEDSSSSSSDEDDA